MAILNKKRLFQFCLILYVLVYILLGNLFINTSSVDLDYKTFTESDSCRYTINQINFYDFEEASKSIKDSNSKATSNQDKALNCQPKILLPFDPTKPEEALNLSAQDYFALVDWTGRLIDPRKKGFITASTPSILATLDIDIEQWANLTQHFQQKFASIAGQREQLYACAKAHGQKWYRGVG